MTAQHHSWLESHYLNVLYQVILFIIHPIL